MSEEHAAGGRGIQSNSNSTGSTACPFFVAHSRREVQCEGYTDDSVVIMRYGDSSAKDQQKRLFCDGRYACCEHYRGLMAYKYDEEA